MGVSETCSNFKQFGRRFSQSRLRDSFIEGTNLSGGFGHEQRDAKQQDNSETPYNSLVRNSNSRKRTAKQEDDLLM